jgi:transcription termination factor Rho
LLPVGVSGALNVGVKKAWTSRGDSLEGRSRDHDDNGFGRAGRAGRGVRGTDSPVRARRARRMRRSETGNDRDVERDGDGDRDGERDEERDGDREDEEDNESTHIDDNDGAQGEEEGQCMMCNVICCHVMCIR